MRGESRLYIGGINGSILAWRQGAKGLADKSNRLFGPDVPIYLHFNGTAFQERFPGCTEGLGRQCGDFRAIGRAPAHIARSEEHTSELQSLMRISYAVFCLKKKIKNNQSHNY